MLPDCRAWEMVSPVDKNGGNIELEGWSFPAAADGNAVSFFSRGSFADTQGSGVIGATQYIAERVAGGWETHAITPTGPQNQFAALGPTVTIQWFSDDLTHAVVMSPDLPKVGDDIAGGVNVYWEDLRNRALTTISKPPFAEEPGPYDFWYASGPYIKGALSSDQRVIAFPMRTRLLEEAPAGAESVYEWEEGALRLASILPDGSPAPAATMPPQRESGALRSVSLDGSLVTFIAAKEGQGQLYARRNHTDTVWVSEPETSAPATAPENVQLQYITPDNRHILFSTTSKLVDGDTNSQLDLYLYSDGPNPSAEPKNLTLISSGQAEGFSRNGIVLGTSDDASSVYYGTEISGSGEDQIMLWKQGSRGLETETGLRRRRQRQGTGFEGIGGWFASGVRRIRLAVVLRTQPRHHRPHPRRTRAALRLRRRQGNALLRVVQAISARCRTRGQHLRQGDLRSANGRDRNSVR
jgi:hypothetical protein